MQNPATFRAYAEECRRLAKTMPTHSEALLQMADACIALAKRAEQRQGENKDDG